MILGLCVSMGFSISSYPKCVVQSLSQKYVIIKVFRIPKFRRRKNSENLIPSLQLISNLKNLFGVTAETSWFQSGQTLILVRVLSQLFD